MRFRHPWNPGYALPGYIKREPWGSPAQVTHQRARGTIGGLGSLGSDELGSLGGHSLDKNVFGGKGPVTRSRRSFGCCGLGDTVVVAATVGCPLGQARNSKGKCVPREQLTAEENKAIEDKNKAARGGLDPDLIVQREHYALTEPDLSEWQAAQAKFQSAPISGPFGKLVKGMAEGVRTGRYPYKVFLNLKDNKKWGFYYDDSRKTKTIKPVPPPHKNWLQKAGSFLLDIGTAIYDAATGLLKLACKLATNPRTGATVDLAKEGIPAGGKVVETAGAVCNILFPGDPGYEDAPAVNSGGLSLPILIGIGALAYLLMKRS